jgi:hypothetical protein
VSRTILLDANVIDEINRGNAPAAQALKQLLAAKNTVYISQRAYEELTAQPGKMVGGIGPDLPRTAAANKLLLKELGIQVAPAGAMGDRVEVYTRNAKGSTLSKEDQMVVAQARALNAEVWSFDKSYKREARNIETAFRVKVAPETHLPLAPQGGKPDYRVARRLVSLPPVDISVGGVVASKPSRSRPPTGGGGSGGTSRTKATVGVPSGPTIPDTLPPNPGKAKMDAAVLGLKGLNFVIQGINDAVQERRMREAWSRMQPNVERQLLANPGLGALILVRFGRREKRGSEHDSPLEHTSVFLSIDVGYGATETEAMANYNSQSRVQAGGNLAVTTQTSFIPPVAPVDPRKLRTPFTSYGIGTFVRGREKLLRVEWKGLFGFDEIEDVAITLPAGRPVRFLLLVAPTSLTFFNGRMRHETGIPVDWRDAASCEVHYTRSVSVVDLDRGVFNLGNDAAAMVFPADRACEEAFAGVGKTKDDGGQLRHEVNLDRVRWVRPENIHVLRKFMEDDPD